jgi:peptide deformylase
MAVLEILHHPDPRLRLKARTVENYGRDLQRLIDDMFETMYAEPGIGLAATQVGVALRIAIMDLSPDQSDQRVLINPEILATDDLQEMEEGCLSVPDYRDVVKRYNRLRLRAFDLKGKPFETDAEGLFAQCVQHEIDHLDGKLYIDYLSALKRERLKKRLAKEARERRGSR